MHHARAQPRCGMQTPRNAAATLGGVVSPPVLHCSAAAGTPSAPPHVQAAAGGRRARRSACPHSTTAAPCSTVAVHAGKSAGGVPMASSPEECRESLDKLIEEAAAEHQVLDEDVALLDEDTQGAADVLKMLFPGPITEVAGEGALEAAKSAHSSPLASIKAWAEVMVKTATLLHATQAELQEMSEADRQAALDMRTQRFIPLPDNLCGILPSVLTDGFYNRPVYDEFLSLMDTLDAPGRPTWALVVTGDSGIGKSTLALRLILRLAARRNKFIYKFVDEENNDALTEIYVDFSDPADIQVDLAWTGSDKAWFQRIYYRDRQVFRLLDGKAPRSQYKGNARTIVFSPPAPEEWNEFIKTARNSTNKKESVTVAWMPWWTADELVQAAVNLGQIPSMQQRQQIEDRFKDLGGIARRVLGDERPSHAILEQLQGELSFNLAQELVRSYDDYMLAELSQRFVRAVVNDKFQFVCWELASAAIAEMVHGKFHNLQWYQLSELFPGMGSNPRASQMFGQLFEQHAHVLGRHSVPAVLGITLAADSVGYLPRADTPPTTTPPGQHPYYRDYNTNAAPAAASSSSSSSPAAASGTTASSAAATPPKAQGKGKRGKSQTTSSGGSSVSAMVQDLDKQQQDHFRALIADAYNRPHRRQLDLGGPLYPSMYLEPVHTTQGSWDAVMWDDQAGFLIVQHTSNVKRGLILEYIKEMLERIKQADPARSHPVHIVFAVPEHPQELFPAFAAQKFKEDNRTLQWEEVPQEVLDIPMWKIELPMTPAKLADASSSLQAATEQRTKERVRFMQICDMTLEQLEDALRQRNRPVKGQNKVQVRNRLLRLENLLPCGLGTSADEGGDSNKDSREEAHAEELEAGSGTYAATAA